MSYDDGSETGPRGTFEIYRAEGDSLYKNGEYSKAIASYTDALEIRENDKDCLVARSRCHLLLGNHEKALQDAELCLKEHADFHKGLYQKAEALYTKGEFELSLVFYHRGNKLRPELQEFRLGIQKSQEAIDNAVGSPEKVTLTKEGDLSYFEEQANDNKQRGKAAKPTYGRPSTREGRGRRREKPKSAGKDKTVKQLLGEMYKDRLYLEVLLKENALKCFKDDLNLLLQDTDGSVYNLAYDGISYLEKRTDFWRQQKPMYARKRDRLQRKADSSQQKDAPYKYVVKELEKIDEEQSEGKFEASLKRARKCLKTIDSYPEDAIENRDSVIATLHSNMGNAHLELGELDKALASHQRDYDIGHKSDNEESKSRALDNMGRVYARKGEFKKAIDSWETKLPMTKTPLETTWLYHEIGRCHLELGNHEEAKDYGEQSVKAANEAEDEMWQLNATVLVAQSEVKLNDLQAALGSFEAALDMAKVQRDSAAEAAIRKAIDDVNSKIVKSLKEEGGQEQESPQTEQEPQEEEQQEEQKEPEQQQQEPEPEPEPEKVPEKSPSPEPVREDSRQTSPVQEEEEKGGESGGKTEQQQSPEPETVEEKA